MSERDRYPNSPKDVTIHHCTKASQMPIEIANRVAGLKQLWIHDDAEKTEKADGSYKSLKCLNFEHNYTVFLGD